MRFVYIALKTPLSSNCFRTEATYSSALNGQGWYELRDVSTGDVIVRLPSSIQELRQGQGTVYEDDAIRVFT